MAENDFFVIIKSKPSDREKIRKERFGERFGENQIKILDLINKNSNISIPQIANELNLTTRAIEKNIAKLKAKNLLKRIGLAKGGYWEIIDR